VIAPTHIVVGQFAYLVAALTAGHPPALPEAAAAGVAALLPDLDKRTGYVGRWLPWLSGPIESAVGHRTATHSLLAVAAVASSPGRCRRAGTSRWSPGSRRTRSPT